MWRVNYHSTLFVLVVIFIRQHYARLDQSNQGTMPEQKPVVVRESSSLEVSGGQTEGMQRANALVGLTPNICASRMIAKPHSASAVHHHGEQDTVVFAFSGHGTIVSEGGKKKQHLSPGDFALIP
jgi:uncharacterized RmlC-like cupin family protein